MSGSLTIDNMYICWSHCLPRSRSKSAEICANGDFCSIFLLFSPLEQGHRPNIDLSSTFGIDMKKKLIAEVRIRHDFDDIWSFSVKNSLLIGSGSWMWALSSLTIGNILDIDLLSNYWKHMWVISTKPYDEWKMKVWSRQPFGAFP